MKKKIFVILIATGVLAFACSCSGQTDTTAQSESTSAEGSSNTNFESVELNNVITTDFCELTITQSVMTHAATEETTGLNLEEQDDNVYIIFLGTVKNTATSEVDFISGLQAQVLIDSKYTYSVEIVPNDLRSIVPLKEVEFAAYVTVPEEVISSCETYELQLGFNDEFDSNISAIEDAAYKYEVSGNIDEYGSAESIQNYQTFFEYVNSFISENGYDEKFECEENNRDTDYSSVVVSNGNCLKQVSENGVEVRIFPKLQLNYYSYEFESQYGCLQIEVRADNKQDNIYYTGANSITLQSDNGEITLDSTVYDRDSVVTTNGFWFYSDDVSFDDIYSVINGGNFKMVISVKTLENENVIINYECDSDMIETLTEMLDIYKQMPNVDVW